jgi:hypothetical protein
MPATAVLLKSFLAIDSSLLDEELICAYNSPQEFISNICAMRSGSQSDTTMVA